jgi:hypothetical protein
MRKGFSVRPTVERRSMRVARIARCRVMVVALAVPLACFGGVSSAEASVHHPTGIFAPFADCPLSDESVNDCVFAQVGGGELAIGGIAVPIDSPLTLQGGVFGSGASVRFVGAEDGNTLSRTALSVPRGVLGWLARALGGAAGVTLTPELARPASTIELDVENLLETQGVAMQLPLKIKLNNPLLGDDCYIGSAADPIVVNLTSGKTSPPAPNRPISGVAGSFEELDEFAVIILRGTSLVDNTFAVPRATGCGGSLAALVEPVVNTVFGLPSPAGRNTAILDATMQLGNTRAVRASE